MNTEWKDLIRASIPVFYLAVHMTVLVLAVLVVNTLEQQWVLRTWYRQGDVDAALTCLVLGGAAFPLVSLLLVRLDGSRRPGITDHIRHCAGIYAVIVFAVAVIVATYAEQRYSLGFGIIAGAGLLGLYAASLNALSLWLVRRQRDALP